mmetsp:Transcript_5408/g.14874  ORF Transcript_5408/g.14874 Transcript_5408/m.14874 type:complete len:256 (-) Transcript_5408:166-933(-)|eukprot:CAMPEP_0185161716 /NCGR_PEP_ID=MMETSP1139-20130426/5448_1 /TAXON_ID=298111 /ORGANISM="Pavlova sp., Strain CCMP459" /LENGTH=255 /DNA_ID=CAMNT_0027726999 /DNA_START=44 /DNA_END=811 /DNA_ORIENTATION=+
MSAHAPNDKANRHALQYRGEIRSYSSKDIMNQLAAAQQAGAQHSASGTSPQIAAGQPSPGSREGGPQPTLASPKPNDPRADNFHALQYKGSVKKFTSSSILDQFSRAAAGENIPSSQVEAPAPEPEPGTAFGELISLDDPPAPLPEPSTVAPTTPAVTAAGVAPDLAGLAVETSKQGAADDPWADFTKLDLQGSSVVVSTAAQDPAYALNFNTAAAGAVSSSQHQSQAQGHVGDQPPTVPPPPPPSAPVLPPPPR